jgi:fumarate hydratase class II
MKRLQTAFADKAHAFKDILKMARTYLQDAVPRTLGQEFSDFERRIGLGIRRLLSFQSRLYELPLGGTTEMDISEIPWV